MTFEKKHNQLSFTKKVIRFLKQELIEIPIGKVEKIYRKIFNEKTKNNVIRVFFIKTGIYDLYKPIWQRYQYIKEAMNEVMNVLLRRTTND